MKEEKRCDECEKTAVYFQVDPQDSAIVSFLCEDCYQWLNRGIECWSSDWQAEEQLEELAQWNPISEFSVQ